MRHNAPQLVSSGEVLPPEPVHNVRAHIKLIVVFRVVAGGDSQTGAIARRGAVVLW